MPSLAYFSLALLLSSVRLPTSESAAVCSVQGVPFLHALESRSPASISPSPPLEVNGNFVDRLLASEHQEGFTSVLFYASWCPFSNSIRPVFDAVSTIFPQINHLAVEQSSTLPSLFSKYGIHSFPSIILVNETTRTQYRGPKTLHSLIQFYEANTGVQPVQLPVLNLPASGQPGGDSIMQLTGSLSLKEMTSSEPYLVLSVLFICLRALLVVLPNLLSHLKAFWNSYIPYLKLKIFGETAQIRGRIVQVIDWRRIWTKRGKACSLRRQSTCATTPPSSSSSADMPRSDP